MTVENVFNFNARDVLAARDDHIFASIFNLDVAIGVDHRKVTGMEPTARKGLTGGSIVLEITLHGDVPAEHDLAHGLAITRHRLHGLRIQDIHGLLQVIANPLAGIKLGALADIFLRPVVVLHTDRCRTIDLGQTVDMGDIKSHPNHAFNHGGRGCSTCNHRIHLMVNAFFHRGRCVNQHAVHDRSTTVVCDAVGANRIKYILRINLTQTDVHARASRNRPRETPAVTVEHR